jgi:cytochrome P450
LRKGDAFRFQPNGLLFNSPIAYRSIYGAKTNIKKGKFYEIWPRKAPSTNTFNTVDKTVHARKRRVLNTAFSEKSLRSAETFVFQHVDRWNELLLENNDGNEWSKEHNMSELINALSFDIMTHLSFGKSLDIKEPGDNPFKSTPHTIAEYLQVMYPVSST